MRRIAPFTVVLLLISLVYFSYIQWFSPVSPVRYSSPLENKSPDRLYSMPVIDLNGKKSTLELDKSKYTVMIFTQYYKEDPFHLPHFYLELAKFNPSFEKNKIRIVYFWISDKSERQVKKEVLSLIDEKDYQNSYWVTKKMLKEYDEKYGIGISINPFYIAYNQHGELILQASWLPIERAPAEILQIPTYDKYDHKQIYKPPGI